MHAMTDPPLVTDYAVTDYLELTTGGAVGLDELSRSGMAYGVLADDHGHPIQLLTSDGPAPLIQVDAATPMERLVSSDVIDLLDRGASAITVIQDARCVGILPAEAISSYALGRLDVSTGAMGDAAVDVDLPGRPPVTPLILTCAVCGAVNSVTYFVDGETPCVNGHTLQVTWD
jgi:hypothetical protein